MLRNPAVATTVVGAMTIEELQADLEGLSVRLDGKVTERLDQIWPKARVRLPRWYDLVRGRRRRCYAGSWSGPSRKVFPPARASIVTPVD